MFICFFFFLLNGNKKYKKKKKAQIYFKQKLNRSPRSFNFNCFFFFLISFSYDRNSSQFSRAYNGSRER